MKRERSGRGMPPTPRELEILAVVKPEEVSTTTWRWVELAQRVGLEPLLTVLDALEHEKLVVPARREFFDRLFRARRTATVLRMSAEGIPPSKIAPHVGLTRQRVLQILTSERGDACRRRVIKGPR